MRLLCDERGQGTVEATFVIPILFLLMLLLVQPGIVLYDCIVMNSAVSEACRLLATTDGDDGEGFSSCERFIRNRLAAIPQHKFFHVHEGGCTWSIQVEGGEDSGVATVRVKTEIRPLPLFDAGLGLLGMTNGSGNLEIGVERTSVEQPSWLYDSVSGTPGDWVGEWCS